MIQLQYKPTIGSRAWRNSSLRMHNDALENMEQNIAPALAKQEGWHEWRIIYDPPLHHHELPAFDRERIERLRSQF